jgi:hypothetical protein
MISDILRVPAWCDRILWTSGSNHLETIQQTEYNAINTIVTSDHVPIYALFDVQSIKQ